MPLTPWVNGGAPPLDDVHLNALNALAQDAHDIAVAAAAAAASAGGAPEPAATDALYFVSPGAKGSDSNDGLTTGTPFATFAHAMAVASDGATIELSKGTHNLSALLTCTLNNLTIRGRGRGTVVTFATNTTTPVLQFSSVTGLEIRNLTIDFGSQTATHASVQVDGTSSGITIKGVKFKNAKQAIILAPGASDNVSVVRIKDCEFDSTTSLGAISGGYTGGGSTCTNINVKGNHVKNVTGTLGNHAFAFYYASNIKIHNNTVEDTADTSCMIAACSDVAIGGNTLWQQHIGVFAGNGSHQVRVYANDIKSVTDEGIAFFDAATFGPSTGLTATGNTIHDCAATAISVSDVNHVTITGNTIARCGQNTGLAGTQRTGITVQINTGGANRGCNHVVIVGNDIFDDGGTPKMQYCIVVQTSITDLIVRGNTVSGATTQNVLWVTSGGGITVTPPYYVETDAGIYQSNRTTLTLTNPTAAYGAGAGTSPPAMSAVVGKDTSGILFFGTGTTPSTATPLFSVTFGQAFASVPRVIGIGNNAASSALGLYVDTGSLSTTGFNVYASTTPGASHAATYEFAWVAVP